MLPLWDSVEKHDRGRQATDDSIILHTKTAICVLDK